MRIFLFTSRWPSVFQKTKVLMIYIVYESFSQEIKSYNNAIAK